MGEPGILRQKECESKASGGHRETTLSKQIKKDERKGKGRKREAEWGGREAEREGRGKSQRFWSWVVCQEESLHSELSLVGWKNPPVKA